MGMDKGQLIDILEEVATLLELGGDNPFKVRAYQNAARVLARGLVEMTVDAEVAIHGLKISKWI
jgi:DNA polymerase (family 10)